jgi:hypothetical protein
MSLFVILTAQLFSAFLSAARQSRPAIFSGHFDQKSVFPFPDDICGGGKILFHLTRSLYVYSARTTHTLAQTCRRNSGIAKV